jgi:hypothetical protein
MKCIASTDSVLSGGAMTPTSDQTHGSMNGVSSDKPQQLQQRQKEVAEKMRVLFAILSEIETNYPEFWEFVQDIVRNELDPRNKIPEGLDLGTWARQQGAQPLEAFIHELEQIQ